MTANYNKDMIISTCIKQLDNFFGGGYNKEAVTSFVDFAIEEMIENYSDSSDSRIIKHGIIEISPFYSSTYAIFLYRLSKECAKGGFLHEADLLYYLNKIMHSVDWYHGIDLPKHFGVEHPVGSVLGRATYGDHLFVYQGTTVGGTRKAGSLCYPTIGQNVVLYANATVLGNCKVGNNVLISANTYLINETIPDNSIVFGCSPSVVIKERSKDEINEHLKVFWNI